MEDNHSHVENPQSQSRSVRPSRSEQSTPRASTKVPPTRGQKRARSRSPDHSRTRARTESMSLPRSLGQLSQRLHHSQSSVKNGSMRDQLNSFKQTTHVTSGQREHQPWREVSQANPHSDFRFSSGSPTAGNKYAPCARLPRRGTMEDSHSHVENPQSQSRSLRPSGSEQSTPRALMEVPPTRGQKRASSRSPDHSRTRARTESMLLPRSLGQLLQRLHHSQSSLKSGSMRDQLNPFEQTTHVTSGQREHHPWREVSQANPHSDFRFSSGSPTAENKYASCARLPRRGTMEDNHSHVENPQSQSRSMRPPRSEQSTPRALMEVPPTRGQKRARSRSPDHSRTRARTESMSLPGSLGELLQRLHHSMSSPTFEQPLVNETEKFFRTQHQETSRQQITGLNWQNGGPFATSGIRNGVQGESSPDTTTDGESCGLRQRSPTTCFYSEVGRVLPVVYSERDNITSRHQITSETPDNTVTLESEQGELRHMFSHYEQADVRAYISTIGIPFCRILNDTTSGAIQSTLRETMTDFSDSSNLMDNDSDLEPSLSALSRNMEREESPNGRDSSHSRRSSGSNSNSSSDSSSHSTLTSSSYSSYTSSSSFSLMSSSSSSLMSCSSSSLMSSSSSSLMSSSSSFSDENSEISIMFSEGSDEGRLSPHSSSETRSDSRSMTPITSDESESWASLDQFFLLNDNHNHPTGLSKAEIDNLAIRCFAESDTLKVCIICITEYTEGNKLRILPCCHEYHVHCIDRWLADNSTCPICRRKVIDSGERENSN
ncbi:PREDICTED: E3 ubiquitin-protein ligase RLIM-like [Miniopterus natalensis]|uniref:E3 ubiquitin-protein ligase RLIM-like n=1 Tax=Miniopterus natalensis TaxID=291302 RepID=UPI0007A6D608|nr:PREDICTED: E3 ubiquitin-protein ligase RLIM-like [Miniopterus natalensis]